MIVTKHRISDSPKRDISLYDNDVTSVHWEKEWIATSDA